MADAFKETAHLNIDQQKFADNFEKIFGKLSEDKKSLDKPNEKIDYEMLCCELQKHLDDANAVIEFYADIKNWHGTTIDNSDRNRIESENYTRRGGKRARSYLDKYGDKQ